ncbi:hypothetical protein LWC35_16455 [Pseudonocardia kujensis]|uniref:hypothetical protein n=1 Tax=Pseudonocardia kujensis TaxID=1128675 RepID=UPI001E2A49B9|nr:hypothetical protein [Pseudonocardia kujensis]MCE0764488.1 hypothetical protein [Pseudonocardia kujensis]
MIVDCDSCEVRGSSCGDCAIGVLLGMPEVPGALTGGAADPAGGGEVVAVGGEDLPSGAPRVQLDAAERQALAVLADQGLLPRLRLVPTRTHTVTDIGGPAADRRNAV